MTKISKVQWWYVMLALLGALTTMYFNLSFVDEQSGFSLVGFVGQSFANHASSSITIDLLVVVFVFLYWSWRESKRLRIPFWWLFVPLTFCIAIAFSFPMFLAVREHYLYRQEALQEGSGV